MKIDGRTHTAVAGEAFHQTTYSATAPVFTSNFTPTANGFTFFVNARVRTIDQKTIRDFPDSSFLRGASLRRSRLQCPSGNRTRLRRSRNGLERGNADSWEWHDLRFAASCAANQKREGGGTVQCRPESSGAPGASEVDVQVASTDADGNYPTISNGNITTFDSVNNTAHLDATLVTAKFVRLLMRSRTNSVTITATITGG